LLRCRRSDMCSASEDWTNLYPIRIYTSPGVILDGGVMWGEVSQTGAWEAIYVNSAGIRVESSPGAIIQDWRSHTDGSHFGLLTGTGNESPRR
jgi:hypothetical protein